MYKVIWQEISDRHVSFADGNLCSSLAFRMMGTSNTTYIHSKQVS